MALSQAKKCVRMREYLARPEVKVKMGEYYAKPDVRARRSKQHSSDAAKAQKRKYLARPETKALKAKRRRERLANDPTYAITRRLRTRMSHAIHAAQAGKAAASAVLLGCSAEFLKTYIESKFLPGMSWDNRHLWHIDHCIPCAKFDMLDPEQQKQCFHYTNLQPLWAEDNYRKGDKCEASPTSRQPSALGTHAPNSQSTNTTLNQ